MAGERHDQHGKFSEDTDKAAKELEVAVLRRDGLSYRAIGERLGFSEATAFRHYRAVQERTRAAANEAAEDLVQTELERLDRAIEKITPQLDTPGRAIRAAEVLEKLSASRRKLLGLDKPVKHEHSGPEGAPIEVDARGALIEKLAGLVAGAATGTGTPPDPIKP